MGILRKALGNNAAVVKQLAHGLDDRPVVNDCAAKSIGKECTFEKIFIRKMSGVMPFLIYADVLVGGCGAVALLAIL